MLMTCSATCWQTSLKSRLTITRGRLRSGQRTDLGQPEGEGGRGLSSDHFRCQDAELDECADLGALDEDGDAVHSRGRHTSTLGKALADACR